jgi:hypothetical protein
MLRSTSEACPRHVAPVKASCAGMKDNECRAGSAVDGSPSIERAIRPPRGPEALVQAMRALTRRIADEPRLPPLDLLVRTTVEHVPGAMSASVTVRWKDRFRTVASTSDTAARADLLQHDCGSRLAPGVGTQGHLSTTNDVIRDRRWPGGEGRAHEETGVASALVFRLGRLDNSGEIAWLNVYSEVRDAFDETSVTSGLVLAAFGSMWTTAMLARQRADNLARALETNREIGMAMGILMQRHRLTRGQAFDALRVASQDSNRKLSDLAAEVADTGTLPNCGQSCPSTSRADRPAGSRCLPPTAPAP